MGRLGFSFDFETELIAAGNQFPSPVCMSYAYFTVEYGVQSSAVVLAHEGVLEIARALLNQDVFIVGANTAFDFFVSVRGARELQGEETAYQFQKLWNEAYRADRVHDVLLRQVLLDLAIDGSLKFEEHRDGRVTERAYNLEALSKRHTTRRLVKSEEEGSWRLRYSELRGLPIAEYPREAYEYSLDDSLATAEVYIAQELSAKGGRRDPRIAHNFPGLNPLRNEFEQSRAAVALRDCSGNGLHVDPRRVALFEELVRGDYAELIDGLIEAGLMRREWDKNTEAVERYISEHGYNVPRTAAGKYSLARGSLVDTGDRLLQLLAYWPDISAGLHRDGKRAPKLSLEDAKLLVAPLVEAGLVDVSEKKCTKAAAAEMVRACKALGRSIPRTKSWDPKHNPEHTADSLECVATDRQSCEDVAEASPALDAYADMVGTTKLLSTDIPILKGKFGYPIHSHFTVILETGRTSSSKPNVQNPPRKPGARECYVAPDGWVFCDVDYGQLELYTLAQSCLWILGESRLAEVLNAGQDPHLMNACETLGISYAEGKANKKRPDVANARDAAKPENFGIPGGLGAAKFVQFCRKGYNIIMPEEEAAERIRRWKTKRFPEMQHYFKYIESCKAPPDRERFDRAFARAIADGYTTEEAVRVARVSTGTFNIVQPWSGRLRAGAGYCAACNTSFQGLGADVAKMALWLVYEACYGLTEMGREDPLYGCKIVNFVHDQILVLAPEERAHEALLRQNDLMNRASAIVTPDVQSKGDPMLTRQWSKKATEWKDGGRYIPWDLQTAANKELEEKLKSLSLAAAREALLKDKWPRDVVAEAVDRYAA